MIEKTLGDKKYYELTEEECGKLIKLGDEAMKNTYPKSGKGYAVALMTKTRNIYTGVSYFSDTETLTMHSEATALAHAAIHGEKDIVAITGPNCHICKQLIYENSLRSGIDIVVVFEEDNQIKQIPISKMMPYPWPENCKMKKPIKLRLQKTFKVKPTKPFAFDPTFHKPDHFTSGDNYWEPGIRWQTWNWQGKCLGIKFSDKGTTENPLVEVKIYAKEKLPENFANSLIEEIKYLYNFDLDLTDFYKTFSKDEILAPIFKKWRGMRPGHPSCLYEYLIIGIVLQNASVRRSVQMFKALLENYGTLLDFDGKKLWCFWSVGKLQKVSEDELRALKVGYRAKSIKKIDDYFSQGLINEKELRTKDRETQMSELLKLYGVGPATAWYLLFDVFHQWDFFNHVSPWEQKIYSRLFFDRNPENPVPVKKILKHFEKFGKYKQLAVHYIWEDLFWKRKNEKIPWLEKQIRL